MTWKAVSRRAYLGLLLAAAILLGSTSLAYLEPALDLPTSIYIGRTILHAGLPYRDAWDLRAPGIFFAFALEQLLLGKSIVGVRVFDLVWQFSTAIILFLIAERVWEKRATGCIAGLLYLLLYFSQSFWNWAEPDGLLSLPLAVAYLLMLKARESNRLLHWGLSAVLVAVAAIFKLPYGLFGLGLLFAAVEFPIRMRTVISRWLALAVGMGAVLGLCCLYFYLKSGLRELVTTQFVFAPHYVSKVHAVITLHDLARSALRAYLFPLYALAGLGLGGWGVSRIARRRSSAQENLMVLWLALALLTFFLHGSYLGYHYLPFLAPAALLASPRLYSLVLNLDHKAWPLQTALIFAAALFLLSPIKRLSEHAAYTWRSITRSQPHPKEAMRELAAEIRQNTSPQDTIFVWGNVTMPYLRADRRAASRFLCTAYLSIDMPELDYRGTLLQELGSNRPVYFIVAKYGAITPALPDSMESLEQFQALKDFLRSDYELIRDTGLYTLYVRRGFPGVPR